MNAAVQPLTGQPGPQVPNAVCFVAGRIAGKRSLKTQEGRLFLTLVKLPAADEFTSPSTVELRSTASLGDVGADIRVKVQIGGYPRAYNTTDKETGEVTNVRTADIRLTVVA